MSRRKAIAFFITLSSCVMAAAITLNVSWIVLHWRQVGILIAGVIFFGIVIAGLVLNTIFLVREIRRNEQQDSFLNAVTHELKTPIASIKLYLETLQSRSVTEEQKKEFYSTMLADADRLHYTVEQVLKAGQAGHHSGALAPPKTGTVAIKLPTAARQICAHIIRDIVAFISRHPNARVPSLEFHDWVTCG